MAREVTFPDHVVEVPAEHPIHEPHGPSEGRSSHPSRPTPPPPPPAPPPIFRRSSYLAGLFVSTSGESFGMGLEIQGGFFGEIDMDTGMMSTGDFMSGANTLSSNASPASGSGSIGLFAGSGTAVGFSGPGSSLSATVTGPLGGVSVAVSQSNIDSSGTAPYQGGSLAYTFSPTGAGAEVTASKSDTVLHVRDTINLNLETHVKDWIRSELGPKMFGELY